MLQYGNMLMRPLSFLEEELAALTQPKPPRSLSPKAAFGLTPQQAAAIDANIYGRYQDELAVAAQRKALAQRKQEVATAQAAGMRAEEREETRLGMARVAETRAEENQKVTQAYLKQSQEQFALPQRGSSAFGRFSVDKKTGKVTWDYIEPYVIRDGMVIPLGKDVEGNPTELLGKAYPAPARPRLAPQALMTTYPTGPEPTPEIPPTVEEQIEKAKKVVGPAIGAAAGAGLLGPFGSMGGALLGSLIPEKKLPPRPVPQPTWAPEEVALVGPGYKLPPGRTLTKPPTFTGYDINTGVPVGDFPFGTTLPEGVTPKAPAERLLYNTETKQLEPVLPGAIGPQHVVPPSYGALGPTDLTQGGKLDRTVLEMLVGARGFTISQLMDASLTKDAELFQLMQPMTEDGTPFLMDLVGTIAQQAREYGIEDNWFALLNLTKAYTPAMEEWLSAATESTGVPGVESGAELKELLRDMKQKRLAEEEAAGH